MNSKNIRSYCKKENNIYTVADRLVQLIWINELIFINMFYLNIYTVADRLVQLIWINELIFINMFYLNIYNED
jgi:hypothetical protein